MADLNKYGTAADVNRYIAELEAKLASITACLEQATISVRLNAAQIEKIADDFKKSGCDDQELRDLCLQGISAIGLKAKLARYEQVPMADKSNTPITEFDYYAALGRISELEVKLARYEQAMPEDRLSDLREQWANNKALAPAQALINGLEFEYAALKVERDELKAKLAKFGE